MMIHIDRGGERMGPYSLEDVNRYLADGTLQPSDLGWYDGAADWAPLTNIEGVVAAGDAVPPPTPGASGSTCPNCQAPVEADQIVCMGCGTRLKEAPAAAKSSKKALFISLGVAGVIMLAVGSYFGFMGDGEADKSEKENTADKSKPKGKTPVKLAEFIKDKRIYVDMPIDPPAEKPFAQFNADGTFQVGAFVNGIASTSGKPDEKGKFSVSELTMTMFDDDGGEDSVVFSKAEPAKGDKISIIDEDGETLYDPGKVSIPGWPDKDGKVMCASSCALIFLGGDKRYLIGDVYLGIHSPRTPDEVLPQVGKRALEAQTYRTSAAIMMLLDQLGIKDDDIKYLFIQVPSTSMYFLNPRDFQYKPALATLATHYKNFWGVTGEGVLLSGTHD